MVLMEISLIGKQNFKFTDRWLRLIKRIHTKFFRGLNYITTCNSYEVLYVPDFF